MDALHPKVHCLSHAIPSFVDDRLRGCFGWQGTNIAELHSGFPMYLPGYAVFLLVAPYALCLTFVAILVVRQVLQWRLKARQILPHKHTALLEGDFIVFIIGLKFNYDFWLHFLRNPGPLFRTLTAMPKILKELQEHPEYGCLSVDHTNVLFSNPTHIVQVKSHQHALKSSSCSHQLSIRQGSSVPMPVSACNMMIESIVSHEFWCSYIWEHAMANAVPLRPQAVHSMLTPATFATASACNFCLSLMQMPQSAQVLGKNAIAHLSPVASNHYATGIHPIHVLLHPDALVHAACACRSGVAMTTWSNMPRDLCSSIGLHGRGTTKMASSSQVRMIGRAKRAAT